MSNPILNNTTVPKNQTPEHLSDPDVFYTPDKNPEKFIDPTSFIDPSVCSEFSYFEQMLYKYCLEFIFNCLPFADSVKSFLDFINSGLVNSTEYKNYLIMVERLHNRCPIAFIDSSACQESFFHFMMAANPEKASDFFHKLLKDTVKAAIIYAMGKILPKAVDKIKSSFKDGSLEKFLSKLIEVGKGLSSDGNMEKVLSESVKVGKTLPMDGTVKKALSKSLVAIKDLSKDNTMKKALSRMWVERFFDPIFFVEVFV